ncbi:hypothetical protein ACHQM5_002371 [Ranunculus cassubicifolius]
MVASAATAAFFPVVSSAKSSIVPGGSDNLDTRGIKSSSKTLSSGGLKVKANAQASPKINGSAVTYAPPSERNSDDMPSVPARTFINQLPDWSVLLTAITAMFLAAEKQWTLLDWKPRRADMLVDPFGLGKIVQDGLVFQQNFSIRSYEIGIDGTTSIESFMNHLQETALNHAKTVGLLGDGFGSTEAMSRLNLIWVVAKMQIQVNRYPSWGDTVQVDTWVASNKKHGMRRDWLVRDMSTGETLARASSLWVMMNTKTRKLSKMPDDVRAEIEPYFINCAPIVEDDGRKLPKLDETTADYVRNGLTPRWNDLDLNQHVNNVKYIGWILESSISMLENHELAGITLEYRKECRKDNVLESLTAVTEDGTKEGWPECVHMLRLDSGLEIVRGRTSWRPKRINRFGTMDQIPAENM